MSFYTTVCLPDRVEVITDGAAWDRDGVVRRFSRKIYAVPGFPAAVTTRGHCATAENVTASIIRLFERAGSYDRAMEILAQIVPTLPSHMRSDNHIEVVIAGMSEILGPVTHVWATRAPADGMEAFTLVSSHRGFICGNEIAPDQHAKIAFCGGLRRGAVEMVDFFRRTADPSVRVEGMPSDGRLPIGGHVDLTTVRADGVTTERLHTYAEDRVGERIDPFASDPSVTSLMTRAERRRLAKTQKRAVA
ncbi:hypothetical protein [Antarcticirhabdus aurantiaca]|uniref:Uncharacterized protein n=1 Tax=Antarcticirhabdus aurantiaca TaxID=2606717 RepID=A0ACD4NVZ7_9HYPH|nr:hypothetical protein OXU80_12400 [Jeongeuplla avenae]